MAGRRRRSGAPALRRRAEGKRDHVHNAKRFLHRIIVYFSISGATQPEDFGNNLLYIFYTVQGGAVSRAASVSSQVIIAKKQTNKKRSIFNLRGFVRGGGLTENVLGSIQVFHTD